MAETDEVRRAAERYRKWLATVKAGCIDESGYRASAQFYYDRDLLADAHLESSARADTGGERERRLAIALSEVIEKAEDLMAAANDDDIAESTDEWVTIRDRVEAEFGLETDPEYKRLCRTAATQPTAPVAEANTDEWEGSEGHPSEFGEDR
jgi:hypothetical protein